MGLDNPPMNGVNRMWLSVWAVWAIVGSVAATEGVRCGTRLEHIVWNTATTTFFRNNQVLGTAVVDRDSTAAIGHSSAIDQRLVRQFQCIRKPTIATPIADELPLNGG